MTKDAPLAAFEVPSTSAVGLATQGTSWSEGVEDAWKRDLAEFQARYESEATEDILRSNVHVAFLCDLQMKRCSHLLPAFLEHVFRIQARAKSDGRAPSQSFASTRLVNLLQAVFDTIPPDAVRGTVAVLHGLLDSRLDAAQAQGGDDAASASSGPVVEAFLHVGFLTTVMTALRMCPSTQVQPIAPLRWLGLASRGELADSEEARALARRLAELQPPTPYEREPIGTGTASSSSATAGAAHGPRFRTDMMAVPQALVRPAGQPHMPPADAAADSGAVPQGTRARDGGPAPGEEVTLPQNLRELDRFHKWTRDFASTPFHAPFGKDSFGKLLPPPIAFEAHEWRRESLSWPVAGVHCTFDEAAALLLTCEAPTFFTADSESFTQAQMLRYLWMYADDPSAGGILDDSWGAYPRLEEPSQGGVGGGGVGGGGTESTDGPGGQGVTSGDGSSSDSAGTGTSTGTRKSKGRGRGAEGRSTRPKHKANYRGQAVPAPGAQEEATAKELRARLDERLAGLSEEEKQSIIERQDPALAMQNPQLALAQAEYEAMMREQQEEGEEGGAGAGTRGSAQARMRLAKRLQGLRATIADTAARLWGPTDTPSQRRVKVIEAVHGMLQGYNYALLASWMDIYFLSGNKEALEAVQEVAAVWTRFGALPFAKRLGGQRPGNNSGSRSKGPSDQPEPVPVDPRDSFAAGLVLDRDAVPAPLAGPGAMHTYPDGLLALEASRSAMFLALVLLELEPALLERFGNRLWGGVTSRYLAMRKVQSQRTQASMRDLGTVHGSVAFAPVCEQSLWVEDGGTQPGDVLSKTRARDALLRAAGEAQLRRRALYEGPLVGLRAMGGEEEGASEGRWGGLLDVEGLGWRGWGHGGEPHGGGPGVLRGAPETVTSLYSDNKERKSAWPALKAPILRAVTRRGMFHGAADASIQRRKERGMLEDYGEEDERLALQGQVPTSAREKQEIDGEPTEDPERVWTPGNPQFACNFGVTRDSESGRVDPGSTAYRERAWAVARPAYEGEISLYTHHVFREFVVSKVEQTGLLGHESTLAGSGVFGQKFQGGEGGRSGGRQ